MRGARANEGTGDHDRRRRRKGVELLQNDSPMKASGEVVINPPCGLGTIAATLASTSGQAVRQQPI